MAMRSLFVVLALALLAGLGCRGKAEPAAKPATAVPAPAPNRPAAGPPAAGDPRRDDADLVQPIK
jgi:hypothetical protein